MDWNAIINAVLILIAVGGVSAVILVVADHFMSVPNDERADAITEVLPGANCGACGYAGCADYAAAIVGGEVSNLCVPGGDAASIAIAEIMGTEAIDVLESVAIVRCRGYCDVTTEKFEYIGISSCQAASAYYKGDSACTYGCLGFGDCVDACKFGAMRILNGVADSDFSICNGCGACAKACPKQIIDILPLGKKSFVSCNSHDKGAVSRKLCSNSCIGCGLCVKACNYDAIHVVNNLAVVDNDKCIGCGECQPVCPTGAVGMIWAEQKPHLPKAE